MTSKISDITKNHLHISHSQVWAYLNCSLRYWFQYVKGLPRERTSIALIFGGAIHKSLERYYLDIMRDNGPHGSGPDADKDPDPYCGGL